MYKRLFILFSLLSFLTSGFSQSISKGVDSLKHQAVLNYAPINAYDVIKQKADSGDAVAQYELASYYFQGSKDIPQDYNKAFEMYLSSAQKKNVAAQVQLAVCYERGLGCHQSYDSAMVWYQKAADVGDPTAENNLGAVYYNIKKDYNKAYYYYQLSADKDYEPALFNCSICLFHGFGVIKDSSLAFTFK